MSVISGWVSIEDGMNGMDEMRKSLDFLHKMRRGILISQPRPKPIIHQFDSQLYGEILVLERNCDP